MQGTIFNWEDIVANSLSSCIVAALGGLTQRKYEFYMGFFLIDCILYTHSFPNLNYDWYPTKTPVYSAYQLLWAHKYLSFYKDIYEYFLIPLYEFIFLEECNCMYEGELNTVSEYGDYFISKEVLYLRMYGGSKAPSLLLRYATDYVIHKEVVK